MPRILIADDHKLIRKIVTTFLQEFRCEVSGEATNGLEAVRMAEQLHPDIVILDLDMPELNGLEAARLIRPLLPTARLIILTVHELSEITGEVAKTDFDYYVTKSN